MVIDAIRDFFRFEASGGILLIVAALLAMLIENSSYDIYYKALLDILVCPQCKGDLQLEEDESGLRCEACRLRYAIRDDIPIMLVEEAQPLDS